METRELITMILEILIALSLLIGGIAFILRWCFKIDKRLIIVEQKIDDLPNRIKSDILDAITPSSVNRIKVENNPLTKEQIQLRNRLLDKLQYKTLTKDEAITLRDMLEIEKDEAERKSKWDLIFAIGIALAGIALIIEIASKKK